MDEHYFNSTHLRGHELIGYEIKANAQDQKVLEFMQHNPTIEVTAEDVNRLVLGGVPETSPRRAMSTLYRRGLITKIGKVRGRYGRPIYLWRLRSADPAQESLF